LTVGTFDRSLVVVLGVSLWRKSFPSEKVLGARPMSPKRQRYLAQAEEFRIQAETFRYPTTQAHVLRLAVICENWARQTEE